MGRLTKKEKEFRTLLHKCILRIKREFGTSILRSNWDGIEETITDSYKKYFR